MARDRTKSSRRGSVAEQIKRRIESDSDRIWSYADFTDLPSSAAIKALSRLTSEGFIERQSKGLYFKPKQTIIGKSKPSAMKVNETILRRYDAHREDPYGDLRPTGLTAANRLGFTTQNPATAEYATSSANSSKRLQGIRLRVRRPSHDLNSHQGALVEFLRDRAKWSELSPEETAHRLVTMLRQEEGFDDLVEASLTEPPRVRAILGALGEQARKPKDLLKRLRDHLNPLSRYDFGKLSVLPNAKEWQAK